MVGGALVHVHLTRTCPAVTATTTTTTTAAAASISADFTTIPPRAASIPRTAALNEASPPTPPSVHPHPAGPINQVNSGRSGVIRRAARPGGREERNRGKKGIKNRLCGRGGREGGRGGEGRKGGREGCIDAVLMLYEGREGEAYAVSLYSGSSDSIVYTT